MGAPDVLSSVASPPAWVSVLAFIHHPRAHLDERIVHDGSVEDRCLHSAFCILIVSHRGERERFPFPPNCLGVGSSRGERDRTYR